MSPFQSVLKLQQDCAVICGEIFSCLEEEKRNLIELKTDEVLQSTLTKERLNQKLKDARERLSHALLLYYNVDVPEQLMGVLEDEFERERWRHLCGEWDNLWEKTKNQLETNLLFIKHSLKNMNLMGDNLKKLMGTRRLYSPTGKKVEVETEGKVLREAV